MLRASEAYKIAKDKQNDEKLKFQSKLEEMIKNAANAGLYCIDIFKYEYSLPNNEFLIFSKYKEYFAKYFTHLGYMVLESQEEYPLKGVKPNQYYSISWNHIND
jgi:hypothetical protein